MILPEDRIVIVGAGCFGVSSAYHLLKKGFVNVSVIERSETLPAKDAASNDINRSLCYYFISIISIDVGKSVVRSSYSDKFYAGLGREAIRSWKNRNEWGDTYHE